MFNTPKFMFTVIATAAISLSSVTVKASIDPIPLYQNSHNIKTLIQSEQAENVNDWKSFTNKYGTWNATIDKAIGTPTIAFGKPIKIIEAAKMDSASILAAVKIFLNENKNIFKVNTEQLKLKIIELVQNKWYVTFGQVFEDYDVMFSKVQFIINQKGEVFNFKVDFYNGINLQKQGKGKIENVLQSVNHSIASIDNYFTSKGTDNFQSEIEKKQIIIPIYKDNTVSYHLVQQVNTINENGVRLYETYVDVHSGEILWQKSCFMDYEAKLKVNLKTYDKYNFEEEKIFPFSKGAFQLGEYGTLVLDENGEITITDSTHDGDTIKFQLYGPFSSSSSSDFAFSNEIGGVKFSNSSDWTHSDHIYPRLSKINFYTLKDGQIDILLEGNDTLFVSGWFDDYDVPTKYPIFGIHHIKIAHDKILEIDPKLISCLDTVRYYNADGKEEIYRFHMQVCFDKSDEKYGPNAFWNGYNMISFTNFLNDSIRVSTCPSVMYHEYGHAINTLFYKERRVDFYNGACHEALADVNANMILDDPIGTQKIFINEPDRYIRNSDNNAIYPDSINGEEHDDGLVLAGAFWDLRKATSLETAYRLSHFARYSLPDGIHVREAFMEWFIATLVADDNDGNLTNGTPNFNEIVCAFNKHGIGIDLFFELNDIFEFELPKDIDNNQTPQKFTVKLNDNNITTVLPIKMIPDNLFVFYSTDYFKTTSKVVLQKNGNVYSGEIPGFDKPQVVRYYFGYTSFCSENSENNLVKITKNTKFKKKVFSNYFGVNQDGWWGRIDTIYDIDGTSVIDNFVYYTGFSKLLKEDFENIGYDISNEYFGPARYIIDTIIQSLGNFEYDTIIRYAERAGCGEGFEINTPKLFFQPNRTQLQTDLCISGNKCLVTGSEESFEEGKRGFLNNGISSAISPVYQIPKVNGNLYLSCWMFEHIVLGATVKACYGEIEDGIPEYEELMNNPQIGFYFMYKTDKMLNWDTAYTALKRKVLQLESDDYYIHSKDIWKRNFFELPDSIKGSETIQFKLFAGCRGGLDSGNAVCRAKQSCRVNIMVDDIELLTDDSTVSEITEESENNFSIISNPNPFTNETNILIISALQQSISGKLIDINGKIIASFENLFINEGETVIPLTNICKQNLMIGAYILTVTANGKNYICKLVKK